MVNKMSECTRGNEGALVKTLITFNDHCNPMINRVPTLGS